MELEGIKQQTRVSIGEQVKSERIKQGLTTRKLAEMCGLSHSHIVRIESGKFAITIDTIGIIAHVLGKNLLIV